MAEAKKIPEGFRTVTPHITVKNASSAIEFYKKAFGAEEICRMPGPDGSGVMYAELTIGDSRIMLNDEWPGCSVASPQTLNGTAAVIHLYVEDVDAAYKRAVDAGGEAIMPVADLFWGDRYGMLKDPFGHCWSIATHTEDLTPEQIGERAAKWFAEMGDKC